MRNDVKTMIAALTTERDSLTRAIESLRQISDAGTMPPTVAKPAKAQSRRAKREFISLETKRAIVAGMTTTGDHYGAKQKAIRSLSKLHGVAPTTIATGWRTWDRLLSKPNGAAEVAVQTPEEFAASRHGFTSLSG